MSTFHWEKMDLQNVSAFTLYKIFDGFVHLDSFFLNINTLLKVIFRKNWELNDMARKFISKPPLAISH